MKAKDIIEVKVNLKKEMPRNTELISLTSKERHDIIMIWGNEKDIECAPTGIFFPHILF